LLRQAFEVLTQIALEVFHRLVIHAAVAKDLTAQTFEKAWRHRHQYRRELAAFLIGCSRLPARCQRLFPKTPHRAAQALLNRPELNQGTTVFLNSHLLSEVEVTCDRVALVRKGRLVKELLLKG
jgi:hypothetical protein